MRPLTWVTLIAFAAALAARGFGAPPAVGWIVVAVGAVLLVLGVRDLLRLRRDGGWA